MSAPAAPADTVEGAEAHFRAGYDCGYSDATTDHRDGYETPGVENHLRAHLASLPPPAPRPAALPDGPVECREEDGGFIVEIKGRPLFTCSRGSRSLDLYPEMTLPLAKSALFALGWKLLQVDERAPVPSIGEAGDSTYEKAESVCACCRQVSGLHGFGGKCPPPFPWNPYGPQAGATPPAPDAESALHEMAAYKTKLEAAIGPFAAKYVEMAPRFNRQISDIMVPFAWLEAAAKAVGAPRPTGSGSPEVGSGEGGSNG